MAQSAQEKQNRRLIEELAQTKQMMISQVGGPNSGGTAAVPGMQPGSGNALR